MAAGTVLRHRPCFLHFRSFEVNESGRTLVTIPGLIPPAYRSVTAPNGGFLFGSIPEEVAAVCEVPAGEIRLLNGFQGRDGKGFGLAHLRAKPERTKQLAGLGFSSHERFVWAVCQGYTHVYRDKTEGLVLVSDLAGHFCKVVVRWNAERTFWSVTTGLPTRRSPDETLLWSNEQES